jgi:hypothetical protein
MSPKSASTVQRVEDEDAEDRRKVEPGPAERERREEPPEEAEVGVDDVVQEALEPVQPHGVGQRKPRREDVDDDEDQIDEEDRVDEVLGGRDGVREWHPGKPTLRRGRNPRLT